MAWANDARTAVERGRRVKAVGRSPLEALALYKAYVAPVPAYRLQSDVQLRVAEEATRATVAAMPMRVGLAQAIAGFGAVGIRVPVRTFGHVSIAACTGLQPGPPHSVGAG